MYSSEVVSVQQQPVGERGKGKKKRKKGKKGEGGRLAIGAKPEPRWDVSQQLRTVVPSSLRYSSKYRPY